MDSESGKRVASGDSPDSRGAVSLPVARGSYLGKVKKMVPIIAREEG